MKILDKFFKDADKKDAISWAFFDFANSSYALLIISFVFPIYFKEVVAGTARGDFYWGLVVSVSILAGAMLSPIVGAMADYDARKKIKFIVFTVLAITGTAFLYFAGSGKLLFTSLIFIIANICFELAQTLYDSFLARVSTKKTVGRISGLAWGFGYIGGVIAMLALKPLYENGYAGDLESLYKLTFPLTALFFLLFSIPSFIFIKEHSGSKVTEPFTQLAKLSFKRIVSTIKNLKSHKKIAWFLLGFYFMNDALVTLFAFVPIYARTTFSMEFKELMPLLLLVQIVGFPAAVIFGFFSDKWGPKKILLTTIGIWAVIVVLMSVATTRTMFYVIALFTGLVMGAGQAIARSWLSQLVPDDKRFEFFGFNGFASKVAATTGPILFGAISVATGNQRLAVAALLPFFIIAFIIFARIKEDKIKMLPNIIKSN